MSADDDRKATETILRVLNDLSVCKIKFMMGPAKTKPRETRPRTIHPLMYDLVRQAIVDGKITVIVSPEILERGAGGMYCPVITVDENTELYDVIVLAKPDLGSTIDQQLTTAQAIIHECTHAGFDLLNLPKMTHMENELGAYIAGAIFVAEAILARKGDLKNVGAITEPIRKAAWEIALLEVEDKDPPRRLYEALELAIRTHPLYKDKANKVSTHDGVGREWKLKGVKK